MIGFAQFAGCGIQNSSIFVGYVMQIK